ncbi:hypothetical protein JW998_03010, partial [candidate division KSB1 bacterium]|nr:hypothetical protein [candidate division KSB1 bacterium]
MQDKYGFIWFATRGGVAQFDGLECRTWTSSPDDSATIPTNYTTCLAEDPSGNMWIGTYDGLCRLDRRSRRIQRIGHNPALKNAWIRALAFDDSGCLWVGTNEKGVFRFSFDSPECSLTEGRCIIDQFTCDPADSTSLSHNCIRAISADSAAQMIYIATGFGLNIWNTQSNTLCRVFYDAEKNSHSSQPFHSQDNDINCLGLNRSGSLWFGAQSGKLIHLEINEGSVQSFKCNNFQPLRPIMSLGCQKNDTHIWLGTADGYLFRFDPETESNDLMWQYTKKTDQGLAAGINHLFFDDSGLLWIGTRYGSTFCDPQKRGFIHVGSYPQPPSTLSTIEVTSVCETRDGLVYVGTMRCGIDVVDGDQKLVQTWRHDPSNPHSLRTNDVLCLYEDRDKFLWIGTTHGLDRFHAHRQAFEHIAKKDRHTSNGLLGDYIYTINEDAAGAIWIGTNRGLAKIEKRSKDVKITNYLTSPEEHLGQLGGYIGEIVHLSTDTLLLGSRGLYCFLPQTNALEKFIHPGQSWIGEMIIFITRDSQHNLWIGTIRDGLYKMSSKDQLQYTATDGVPDNFCSACLEDAQGHIWISTFSGLVKYNPATDAFDRYDMSKPSENVLRWRVFCKGPSGCLYFGHYYGYVFFDPADLYPNTKKPPVYITDFKIYNQSISFASPIIEQEKIDVQYNDKMFSLDFAALNYRESHLNQYQYRLEGFDDRWIEPQGQRTAYYTNVPPGRYTFHVKASNNDGLWNDEGAMLRIHVLPPWWRTTWAYLLWFSLFFGAVYAAYRLQLNRARLQQRVVMEHEQAEKLHELDRLKSSF